jgi:hypothetical protein
LALFIDPSHFGSMTVIKSIKGNRLLAVWHSLIAFWYDVALGAGKEADWSEPKNHEGLGAMLG